VPGQVDQFAADLPGGEAEEMLHRLGRRGVQGLVEPHGGVLEHIVGVFPAMHPAEIPQHLGRQAPQPVAGAVDQFTAGERVARV
jgi:hypothetical protein